MNQKISRFTNDWLSCPHANPLWQMVARLLLSGREKGKILLLISKFGDLPFRHHEPKYSVTFFVVDERTFFANSFAIPALSNQCSSNWVQRDLSAGRTPSMRQQDPHSTTRRKGAAKGYVDRETLRTHNSKQHSQPSSTSQTSWAQLTMKDAFQLGIWKRVLMSDRANLQYFQQSPPKHEQESLTASAAPVILNRIVSCSS